MNPRLSTEQLIEAARVHAHYAGNAGDWAIVAVMEQMADRLGDALKLEEIRALHHSKTGKNNHGEYVICDYDKTQWPCRTAQIIN